jgi:F0F1-type ATP synthase assembly protein I
LLGQLVATLLVAAICGALGGAKAAGSAVLGGAIGMVATAYMAFALLKHDGSDARRVARSFFVGWALKVAFTVALLVIAIRSKSVAPLPLIAGYAITYFAYGLAALPRRYTDKGPRVGS